MHKAWKGYANALRKKSSREHAKVCGLAENLLARHLQLCSPDLSNRCARPRSVHGRAMAPRVVAVVGAGTSSSLLPASEEVLRNLTAHDPNPKEYESELNRLQHVFGLKPGKFETFLAALARSPDREASVRQVLSRTYSRRHPAVMAYELLAHLMKHRFLDAIITFNFDELLDQSLADELGQKEYHRIISERDCYHVIFDPDAPDYVPLFMKLHGTASDPESLRFTRNAYYAERTVIDQGIRALLGKQSCVLLNVGSSLSSFEFNWLLSNPRKLQIYNLTSSRIENDAMQEVLENRDGLRTKFVHFNGSKWPKVSGLPHVKGADRLLYGITSALAQRAERCMRRGVPFRSVDRHILVSELLSWKKHPHTPHQLDLFTAEYLKNRTVLEIAFAAMKSRGLVSIDSLVRDRCGTYYDYLRRSPAAVPWADLCTAGGLRPDGVSGETYFALSGICSRRSSIHKQQSDIPSVNRRISPKKHARLVRKALRLTNSKIKSKRRKAIRQVLRDLGRRSEVEIRVRSDSICSKTFSHPVPVVSHTALQLATIDLLESGALNYLAVIAETGEWLLKDTMVGLIDEINSHRTLRILLIVAFSQLHKKLLGRFGKRIAIQRIPWWRHNRHMTVGFADDRVLSGIYFARRLRTPFITPVAVGENDAKLLARGFFRTWMLASRGNSNSGIPESEVPTSLQELLNSKSCKIPWGK